MTEQITEQFQWNFPGGWWGLAAATLLLVLLIAVSYRYTAREIRPYQKIVLATLRIIFCVLILLCLANPRTETERTFTDQADMKIAVIFDESGSMLKPDQWKRSRLRDALSYWNDHVKKDSRRQTYEFYRFGNALRQTSSFDEPPLGTNAGQTNFYDALVDWCGRFGAGKYGGVVCFTDGIDTSLTTQDTALNALDAVGIPHLFVPMTNELAAPPDIRFRKVESPTHVFTHTENDLTFLVRCSNMSKDTKPKFELLKDGNVVYSAEIQPGTGLRTFKYRYPAALTGTDRMTARITASDRVRDSVNWTIEKTEVQESVNVLVFNGALDFGTRFIRNALADDKSVKLDVRFANGVFPDHTRYGSPFPNADDLKKFDVLLLMNMRRGELPKNAEKDIYEFVRNGGGLLFVTGNPGTAREYAQSTLEKLLPVTFDANAPADPRSDPETSRILREIARGVSPTRFDGAVRSRKEFAFRPPPLYKFELTDLGRKNPIFNHKSADGKTVPVLPEFQDEALVESLKPGANLLAYHTLNGKQNPLLAYQNFGSGRSMVLAADPLWRWRLNLPSNDHSYEIFWKNTLSYLGAGRNRQTRWIVPNFAAGNGAMTLYLEPGPFITDPALLNCRLEEAGGTEKELPVTFEGNRIRCSFPIKNDVEYTVRAIYDKKPVAELTFSTLAKDSGELESRILEPDLAALEKFAALPQVKIVRDNELVLADHFNHADIELKEHSSRPLWHRPLLFILLAAVYLLELILRRVWKLI